MALPIDTFQFNSLLYSAKDLIEKASYFSKSVKILPIYPAQFFISMLMSNFFPLISSLIIEGIPPVFVVITGKP